MEEEATRPRKTRTYNLLRSHVSFYFLIETLALASWEIFKSYRCTPPPIKGKPNGRKGGGGGGR